MDPTLLFDPLFRLPFAAGLPIALVLPLLGALLLLRAEWLAALGLAHLAAAGALGALAIGLTPIIGGALAALGGGALKAWSGARGNAVFGFMILGGWATLILVAANSGVGSAAGQALIEGQVYFAGWLELIAAGLLALVVAMLLPWLMPRLLRARLFPHHDPANRLPAWRWHLTFDLLAAIGIAIATATLGLMAAFALVLVPAWVAFRLATGWSWALLLCAAIGAGGYVLAFALALVLDQPFGPVLVLVLLVVAGAAVPGRRGRDSGSAY